MAKHKRPKRNKHTLSSRIQPQPEKISEDLLVKDSPADKSSSQQMKVLMVEKRQKYTSSQNTINATLVTGLEIFNLIVTVSIIYFFTSALSGKWNAWGEIPFHYKVISLGGCLFSMQLGIAVMLKEFQEFPKIGKAFLFRIFISTTALTFLIFPVLYTSGFPQKVNSFLLHNFQYISNNIKERISDIITWGVSGIIGNSSYFIFVLILYIFKAAGRGIYRLLTKLWTHK
jgi:hypothetical protein